MGIFIRRALLAAVAVSGLTCAPLADAQIISADAGKNLEFQQTGPSTVTPVNSGSNAFFYGRTFYTNTTDFDGGDVQVPDGGGDYLYNSTAFDCCGHLGGQYQTGYMTPAAMQAAFPNSSNPYVLTATNSGAGTSQQLSIVVSSDALSLLPLPAFSAGTYNALLHPSAGPGPVVSFNSFSAPTGEVGTTFLSVFNQTTNTFYGGYFGPGASTSSFDLSGVPFVAGDSYELQLVFDSAVNSTSDVTDETGALVATVPVANRSDLRTDLFFSVPGAVPEPSTWALLLLGFGLAGGVLRRRDRLAPAG